MTLPARIEISDAIVQHDPATGRRMPVSKDAVIERLRASGQSRAARIVSRMPAPGGVLDPAHVDDILIRSHTELQRLSEEFLQPRRVLALLRPAVDALRATRPATPIRIVDLGTGLGYLPRWLAARGGLGEDVDLVGVDFNASLIDAAAATAAAEGLRCRFVVGDALQLQEPATIVTSVGVLHHFSPAALGKLFAAHEQAGIPLFMHYDIAPSWIAPFGAWLFHTARMRQPLARHDGVLSARRSHGDATLVAAATASTTRYRVGIFGRPNPILPINRVVRPVVGIKHDLVTPFTAALGSLTRHLELQP